jgi:hypothetical protein
VFSQLSPVIPFLYHAGSNDPTDSHQDEKLVTVYMDPTHLASAERTGGLCLCGVMNWENRTLFTGIRVVQEAASPHGCLPLTMSGNYTNLGTFQASVSLHTNTATE